MRVQAVVVTFNRLPMLQRLVPRLLATAGLERILVVDNASTDGTGEWLAGQDDVHGVTLAENGSRDIIATTGSIRTGFGCVESDGSRHRLIRCGAISAPARAAFPDRLRHIHAALVELVRKVAAARPVIILFEDLHWADEMSVRLQRFEVGRPELGHRGRVLGDLVCLAPGVGVGQRIPNGYNGLLGYNALPYDVRSQYGAALDPRSNYIYDQSYLYRVDPTTMLVQQVLGALVR